MAEVHFRRSGGALLLFLVPVVLYLATEITVLILLASVLKWWTLALLIATMIVGGWLLQREGRKAWQALMQALASGSLPPGQTTDAVLILIGGFLLIMPGIVSDVLALLLLISPTRRLVRVVMGRWFGRTMSRAQSDAGIIQGEVVSEEPDDPGPPDTLIPQISPPSP